MLEEAEDVVTLPARFVVPLIALLSRRERAGSGNAGNAVILLFLFSQQPGN